jgi:hypothetical protein
MPRRRNISCQPKAPAPGSIERNSKGDKYSLYSLRHFYSLMALRKDVSIWAVAENMGTSVQMIKQYCGKQGAAKSMAITLGGIPRYKTADTEKRPGAQPKAQIPVGG